MNLRPVLPLTGVALLLAGCGGASSQPGPFAGAGAAAAASSITRAGSVSTAETQATGAPVGTMAQATIFILAKHQATERQRQIAIRRAQAVVEHHRAAAPKKKLPRYIAVDTVRDEHTAPKAEKAVVIWDTQSQEIVGNNVYDIANAPAVGATSRFETYSAEYVGAGL